jgi:hypothetical protein
MRIWISPAAILVFTVVAQTVQSVATQALFAAEAQEQENSWTRMTFPGPRHEQDPAFPARQGSDRSEYMWFLEVSPLNSSFMILSHNMGAAFVTRNGRRFEPLDLSLHRSTNDVAFSPHDGNTAYLV